MPTYVFECQDCETQFEEFRKISEYDQPASCPNCESDNTKKVITAVGFILKGDGWAGKNHRIEGQMRDKNKRLKKKEDEYKGDGMVPQLAPNVDGERVSSWSEASKLAKSKGKDTSGYDLLARKDKTS